MTRLELSHLGTLFAIGVSTALLLAHSSSQLPAPRSARIEARPVSPRSATGSIPAGTQLVVTASFDRLRELGFGRWWAAAERELGGVGKLSELCGFDPTARLRELAVSVPALGNGEVELGFVATGDFPADPLVGCAKKVITRRGGHPSSGRAGSFLTIGDPAQPGWGQLAVRDGGPVLLGRGAHLGDLIEATEGRRQNLDSSREHAELRRALGPGGALVASWALRPGSARQWLGDTGIDGDALDALRAAAARLDVGPGLSIEALLTCSDPKLCLRLEEQLGELGRKLLAPWLEAWLGWPPGPAQSEREPNRLRVHWHLGAEQTKKALDRVADWLGPSD